MARHQHLPIYRLSYELFSKIMLATKNFPRDFKFSIGQKIKEEMVEVIVLIYRANSSEKKQDHIAELIERLVVVQLLCRLCHDSKVLTRKHYSAITEMTESILRQAQGWKKASAP
jgi:hypothetical protein